MRSPGDNARDIQQPQRESTDKRTERDKADGPVRLAEPAKLIIAMPCEREPAYLAWYMELEGPGGRKYLWVDAQTGAVRRVYVPIF